MADGHNFGGTSKFHFNPNSYLRTLMQKYIFTCVTLKMKRNKLLFVKALMLENPASIGGQILPRNWRITVAVCKAQASNVVRFSK
jgi:hypothetical protein